MKKYIGLAAALAAVLLLCGLCSAQTSKPSKADEMFGSTKIWTMHIKVSAEDWKAMQGKAGKNRFFRLQHRIREA